jgi:hypothetical protein
MDWRFKVWFHQLHPDRVDYALVISVLRGGTKRHTLHG